MMTDIWTVIWKEWRELLFQRGSLKTTILSWLPLILIFGLLMPIQIGTFWVDSPFTIAYWGWLPTLPVMALIADSFAGERERHTLETLLASPLSEAAILFGKIITVVIYGLLLTVIVLLTGLIAVNLTHNTGAILLYPIGITLTGIGLGILTATAMASIGVIVSLRSPTVKQAAQQLAFVSIALTWIPLLSLSLIPTQLQTSLLRSAQNTNLTHVILIVFLVLAIANLGLLFIAIKRFKRSRLILD
ncbi:ABC transporter permease [Chroococcidiopsis sp.]|uniref:ABC transporter permease n=1 Tax=Chroococcidiopsis sp. TaxID=3088168 RepID=UPI003F416549